MKLFTTVPHSFIDDFFKFYTIKNEKTDFTVDLDKLAQWLDCQKTSLFRTLKESYKQDIDYNVRSCPTKKGNSSYGGNRNLCINLTLDCMKRMCMRSKTPKAEQVRSYFIEIEEFQMKYNDQIVDGLMRDIQNDAIAERARNRNDGPGWVYIFRASKKLNVFKLGETIDLIKRLRSYNTGRIKDIEFISKYKTSYRKEVERCVKRLVKERRYKSRRELYQVDLVIIQKLIMGCSQLSLKLQETSPEKEKLDGDYFMIFQADVAPVK